MAPLLDAVELGTALYVFVLVFTFVGTGMFIAPSILAQRVHQRADLTEDQKSAWRNVMWFIPYAWIFYLLVDDEVTAGMFTTEIPRNPGVDVWERMGSSGGRGEGREGPEGAGEPGEGQGRG